MPVEPEAAFARCLDGVGAGRIGIAVSGGGDSMALLHMAHRWDARRICAATVNHGLRAEAAAEAEGVARVCAALGIPHVTLQWQGWSGQGNLQAAARAARAGLLTEWAGAEGLEAVLLGHTADDQAETVLMRLARGSGVDGLCGMEARSGLFLRPLLEVSRDALRDWLEAQEIGWVEDPSNDDLRFDRIKARRLLDALGGLGLTQARLVQTAEHMQRARATLWQAARDWAGLHVRAEAGDLVVDADALDLRQGDSAGRVLAAAVQWIGGAGYRPRLEALHDFAGGLRRGEARTLGGVWAQPEASGARLMREPGAVQGPVPVGAVWDGRWAVSGPGEGVVAALGEAGLAQCPHWRETGLPRRSLLASPAVWRGDSLIAAPLAGLGAGWQAGLCLPFDRFIVSH